MRDFIVPRRSPLYLSLSEEEWDEKIDRALKLASPCVLCPRHCGVARFQEPPPQVLGICKTADRVKVSGVGPHFGEEPPLVGTGGSGTIFFSHCNLGCLFCQNYQIAHHGQGKTVSDEELSQLMLQVQDRGCHNVNLVSPTHVVPNILRAVRLAARKGLRIPLVYNTGGYDSPEALELLAGVIDIYMPDMKYGSGEAAGELSQAPDYPRVNFAAVSEMYRQVGHLVLDHTGLAVSGLLVRHLVLPGGKAGTRQVVEFIARRLSRDTYVNIMAQYRPHYQALDHPQLGRRLSQREYQEALAAAQEVGLRRVWGM